MNELFQDAFIGTMQVRNRFVRSATWEGMAGENGEVTEPLIALYRNLAKGGVGLILTSYSFVTKRGKALPRKLGIDDDSLIPGLRALTEAVHAKGGRVVMQIAHGGSLVRFETGLPIEAPSAVPDRATGNTPVEMTGNDIRRVVEEFAEAGRRAKDAGFDGVQLHGAHGYLLSQFLSPYSNRRTDQYGGPIQNRARILFDIYDALRGKVGADFPTLIKINVSDFDGVGLTPEDSLWVCQRLSEMGIDAIELSGGTPAAGEQGASRLKINSQEKEAYFKNYARQFKPHLKCPVILVGGLRSPEVIEEVWREGAADFFSMCRPLISEPDLIRRWQAGERSKARCISCGKCRDVAYNEGRLYCATYEKPGRA